MALQLDDRPDTDGYDDSGAWWHGPGKLDDLEQSSTATDPDNTDDDSHQDDSSEPLDAKGLQTAEAGTAAGSAGDGFYKPSKDKNDGGADESDTEKQGRFQRLKSRFAKNKKRKKRLLLLAGSGSGVLGLIAILIVLSSFKGFHFAQVLTVTGYARFNGIMQERTTQDIFDASMVEGDSSIPIRGRTIIDRIKLRNVDLQISELGQDGTLKFLTQDGNLVGIKTVDKTITLDGISQEMGFGNFSDLRTGVRGFFNGDFRKRAAVRAQFVDEVGPTLGDATRLEPRYLRGRVFGYVADNVDFSWNRFAQQGRKFIGASPEDAVIQDTVNQEQEISGKNIVETGNDLIDGTSKQVKNAEKLKKFLEENGGQFDAEKYMESLNADIANATRIQKVATNIGRGVLIASLACMAHQAFAHTDDIAINNEKSAENTALNLQGAGSEAQKGVTPQAMEVLAHQVDGGEQAPDYQASTNQQVSVGVVDIPLIKPNIDPNFAKIVSTLTTPSTYFGGGFFKKIPGFKGTIDDFDKQFCNLLLSPQGALVAASGEIIAQAVIAFLSDGSGVVADEAGGEVAIETFLSQLGKSFFETSKDLVSFKSLGTLAVFSAYAVGLKFVSMSLAGSTISGAEQGPDYVERAFLGACLLQSRQARTMFGRPLTPEQAQAEDTQYSLNVRQQYNNQGVFARYFSLKNPFSMASMATVIAPSSAATLATSAQNTASWAGKVVQPWQLFKSFGSLSGALIPHASAAAASQKCKGITQWGFSPDELDKMRNDPSYSVALNPLHISDDDIAKYDKEIGMCFDPSKTNYEIENQDKYAICHPDSKIWDNDQVFRYRLYKYDNALADMSQEDLSHGTSDSSTVSAFSNPANATFATVAP